MIKKLPLILLICEIVLITITLLPVGAGGEESLIKLPTPKYSSNTSIENALLKRRSVRDYKDETLNLAQVSQLLWACQGITEPQGLRTVPSAGALYPLEVYVIARNVSNLLSGIYKYKPHSHALLRVALGDRGDTLCTAALEQLPVKEAPLVIVVSAVYERTAKKYGERAMRYAHIEAGACVQSIYLQAVSLNLGTVIIGAFDDNEVKRVLNMKPEEQPLCIMPVGRGR